MAMRRIAPGIEPWAHPRWPGEAPDPARVVIAYGELADELVIGFDGPPGGIVVPLASPAADVAVLVDPETGVIVGAQVDNLRLMADSRCPGWRRLTEPSPPGAAIVSFVATVKALFGRYGVAA